MPTSLDAALATAPNASIPFGFRKKMPTGDERFGAAGVLFVTPQNDALFLRRTDMGDHGGEWSIPAGKAEQDEEPADTARRECLEEIGMLPSWQLAPLHRETSDEGVDFSTFGAGVKDRFDPVLNDEHDEYVWAPLSDPPQPLHPGLKKALAQFFREEADEPEHEQSGAAEELEEALTEDWNETDRFSMRQRMIDRRLDAARESNPRRRLQLERDADYLDDLLRQETEERLGHLEGHDDAEDAEDSDGDAVEAFENGIPQWGELEGINYGARDVGATDSALRLPLALDKDSVRKFDKDGRMRVSVANISKANVCPYRGAEIPGWQELGLEPDKIYKMFRHPDELKKSVPTWNGIQLLSKHVPVDAEDHRKYDIVGTTGTNASFEDPYLRNSLVIWSKDGVDLIESDKQRELSCGYHYTPEMTPGMTPHGEQYDGVMRDISGNHVALVEEGRAGPDVMVGDTLSGLQWDRLAQALEAQGWM
jgi:8-oxo-dGTP pyrophosphatase MutT (NUDIX family)